ncbi:cytidyltransferase [Prauserella alba]|uniref:FAD synthase n=1 Tax=Prauserella alba TaxID=176898 RepID=A0ABN1VK18_9PSEU|nr:cytidyltransferase [Prauserella alba]MCP2182138.1 riboflavin kinase / FMN adenylyltransferase [Prauserella alba]
MTRTAGVAERAGTLWWGLTDVPADLEPRSVTLGVFDGMHRGHARVLQRACAQGLPTVLVTFDPHPGRVVGPTRDTAALCSPERRARLAWSQGVDEVCVLPFSRAFADLSPAEFVSDVLVGRLHAASVVVGANFTFGRRGSGDVETLREAGARHGFAVEGVELLSVAGDTPCSSTYIRTCVRDGDLAAAERALGRPHRLEGPLVEGVLKVDDYAAMPPAGRYAGRLPDGPRVAVEVTASCVVVRGDGVPEGGHIEVDLVAEA